MILLLNYNCPYKNTQNIYTQKNYKNMVVSNVQQSHLIQFYTAHRLKISKLQNYSMIAIGNGLNSLSVSLSVPLSVSLTDGDIGDNGSGVCDTIRDVDCICDMCSFV